jgi:hypothetical protein
MTWAGPECPSLGRELFIRPQRQRIAFLCEVVTTRAAPSQARRGHLPISGQARQSKQTEDALGEAKRGPTRTTSV